MFHGNAWRMGISLHDYADVDLVILWNWLVTKFRIYRIRLLNYYNINAPK